jgi:predicted enzyme related to lactoylglutathione lyase
MATMEATATSVAMTLAEATMTSVEVATTAAGSAETTTSSDAPMINGAHAIIYSTDADADRAFFQDVLALRSVDAGGGWLIFALPPAELAVHPAEPGTESHELYLLCEDIDATVTELEGKRVHVERPFVDQPWGRLAYMHLPGGGRLGIYQPRHPQPS